MHGDLQLWLRVHGFEREAGCHAPYGPDLPDSHSGDWQPGSLGDRSPGVMCFSLRVTMVMVMVYWVDQCPLPCPKFRSAQKLGCDLI